MGSMLLEIFPVIPRGFESFTRPFGSPFGAIFKRGGVNSDSERIDSAQFSRNSDSRDVSCITVSTLPLTTKYPDPQNTPTHQVF